ncbi:MAG: ribonuclease HII [Acidimicrobiales bacterium]
MASAVDLLLNERALISRGDVVVGLDEVGRGSLAGPLVVGAVTLSVVKDPPGGLNDSKALSPRQREALVPELERWCDEWSLGWVSAVEIDEWGLAMALSVAANRALDGLTCRPSFALVDGPYNFLRAPRDVPIGVDAPPSLYADLAHTTIVKGDSTSAVIAAASVVAKVRRDQYMRELHAQCPYYAWESNKGYGSAAHLTALRALGPSNHHRRSWKLPN